MHLEELAPAKINLTLSVLGRRPDGYHELDSLVAFASCGDRVILVPGSDLTVRTRGPFATAITEDNLIAKAARLARSEAPALILGAFTLDKNLPVAAGIGGGSSDAAAALLLLQRANPEMASAIDWSALAARCGADVPVCLRATATRMLGLGERLEPLPPLPPIDCVIVNPGVPLATPAVFRALSADRLVPTPTAPLPPLATRGDLLRHLHATGNDLQAPAMSLCPAIAEVLDALGRLDGAEFVRMSGSGPTCFALFPTFDRAVAAAASLAARRPGWWVVPARLS